MADKPLVQMIFEEDLLFKPSKKKNAELAKQVTTQFAEASNYPFDASSFTTSMLGRTDYGQQALGFNVYSKIPGTSIISNKAFAAAVSSIQSSFRRVYNSRNVFDPNVRDAVSWAISNYDNQILAEIEKLPRIIVNDISHNQHHTRGRYNCPIGELSSCIDPKFMKLCRALHNKIMINSISDNACIPLLSAIIRQIAIRTCSHLMPPQLVEALKAINNHFVFLAVVPGRAFYLPQEVWEIKTTVEIANSTSRLVLHSVEGAALKVGAKTGFHFVRGRSVPAWVTTCLAKDMPERKNDFFRLNVEQRRIVLERIGPKALVRALGAKTLDERDEYKLLEVNIPQRTTGWGGTRQRPCKFLQMQNPSIKTDYHLEGVDNRCETVDDAIKWRNHDAETMPLALT